MPVDLSDRTVGAARLVTDGDFDGAVSEVRRVLADPRAVHPAIQMNCAGILVDAGERLDQEAIVLEGLTIFDRLLSGADVPENHKASVRYGFANGRAALLQMKERRRGRADEHVRPMHEEEEVVALYYDSTELLREAQPETVINCTSVLRLQGRAYEALDLLDVVLSHHPDHPNAHMKMAEMLFFTFWSVRGRDAAIEALLIPAFVHYDRAIAAFDASDQPDFAADARVGQVVVRAALKTFLGVDDTASLTEHLPDLRRPDRVGAPLGLRHLARSPYRGGDDAQLLELVRPELKDIVTDAAGTFFVGRSLLKDAESPRLSMPDWQAHTPDAPGQLQNAAVRQFWSALEKVAWLVNEAFQVGISARDCKFSVLFRPPSAKQRKALGLPEHAAFHPNLQCENPGLQALAGLSCAFDTERRSVYVPLKRLRHAVEHRVPDQPATRDDAAFLLGIARAAILHGVDAVVRQDATRQPGNQV